MKNLSWKSEKSLILILALLCLLASGSAFFQGLERKAYDFGMRVSHRAAGDHIALIAIDDESIANIGRWPWSRDIHAAMLDKLAAAQPKVIGSTVLYLEPQVDAGLDYINKIASLTKGSSSAQLNTLITEAQTKLNTDAELAASIQKVGNVVLGMPFVLGEAQGNPDQALPKYVHQQAISALAKNSDDSEIYTATKVSPPVAPIGSAAVAIGHLNMLPDVDGAIRVAPLLLDYYGQYFPALSLQIAARYLNLSAAQIQVASDQGVQLGKLHIATDGAMQMNTYFYQGQGGKPAFSVDSFYDVLNGKINPEKYHGKIVLIGATAVGVGDAQVTPISANTSPLETLAHEVASILNQDYITVPAWAAWVEFLVWLAVSAYLILLLPKLDARKAMLATGAILLVLAAIHIGLMTQQGWWLQLTMPAILLLAGHALLTTRRYFATETGKEKSDADSAESNRNLALMFQSQGQLDMAFDRFRKCPMDDAVMDGMYHLGLDFERKRQFNKAEAVFAYIAQHNANYKDIAQRISVSRQMSETLILGGSSGKGNESRLVLNNGALEKPMLGRYQVEKELGKGAMGVVYQGRDPKIGRVVAIKTMALSQEFEADELEEVKARFFREAETAGRLNHPNIVTIYDAGEEQDLAYIAMELLQGEDLMPYTRANNLLPQQKLVDMMVKVAQALDYAHAQHVIHRDIKPSNIMYDAQADTVKVTDFGIARITDASKTKTGVVLGTPSYMSPEQLSGKKLDGRSDIFSLGVTCYSLLTGQLPFAADSMAALMFKIANEPFEDMRKINPKISLKLVKVVNKMLEKDVNKRYQTAIEIAEDLQKISAKGTKV